MPQNMTISSHLATTYQHPGNLPQHSSTVTVSFPLTFSTEILFNLQFKLPVWLLLIESRL